MRLAIISDTHDNVPNLENALQIINQENISLIIHCGDVTTLETLKIIQNNFERPIYLSRGNADNFEIKNQKNIFYFDKFGEIKIDNKLIAFTHFPNRAKELANKGKYDLVFYGHTHKPWEEIIDVGKNVRLVNPGNLAGIFYKATFAIYNTKTDKLELKILAS